MGPDELNETNVLELVPHVQTIVENLLRTWDSISNLERILNVDLSLANFVDLAATITAPEDVVEGVDRIETVKWLTGISSQFGK